MTDPTRAFLFRIAANALAAGFHYETDPADPRGTIWTAPHGSKLNPGMILPCALGAEWMRGGLPIVSIPDTYAAALMSTSTRGVPDEMIRAPWRTFVIHSEALPALRNVIVWSDGGTWTFIGYFNDERHSIVINANLSLNAMRDGEDVEQWGDEFTPLKEATYTKTDFRRELLLRALILNTCVAMNEPGAVQHRHVLGKVGKHGAADEPSFDLYKLGRPVSLDCRPALRDYIAGKGNARKVKWITRGHWTHQPHGPGAQLRSLRWREPHWNNRKKLVPVNLRTHRLEPKQ